MEFDFVKWINDRFYWESSEAPSICGTEEGNIMLTAFDPRTEDDYAEGKTLKELAYNWDHKNIIKGIPKEEAKEWIDGEWIQTHP